MSDDPMLLHDALRIPKQVTASDFVLQLHAGVDHAERTLDEYVVTDSLAASFDEALSLIDRTLAEHTSKGAFVHGSFGSGKSHFLAVVHLLLAGNTSARALPGLQAAVAAHQGLLDRRILAVDYHLLGADSFESALFDGYRTTIAHRHPDAPAPVLHKSDSLIIDAQAMRERLGDETFFAALNASTGGGGGWGDLETGWDATTFDTAAAAGYQAGNDRERLVRALTSTLFTGYTASGEWLDISTGLEAMTAHARDLGYDGIVLFLDELVLWLAQHLGDSVFIQTETSKVAKLVESGVGSLPLPMFSFVARQRDLKDFLGGGAIGAEREAIGQSFGWWEDRFERLTLDAADLPRIAHQRLLQPVDTTGRQAVEKALDRVKANRGAWQHLLSDEAGSGEVDFALIYPFSPALVDALIALSSLMQRERTALKIMGELLATGYDTLQVTDVIPVGDLFDAVVDGANPLSPDMKKHFENARVFYRTRMRPYLLAKHNLDDATVPTLPRCHPFRTEDRLAKTLLVAALAPGAPSLRTITAEKLAALNFGTIASFVPGQEATTVRGQVRDWTGEFPEVRIGDGTNPVLSIELAGVDYESVVERVQNEDTEPARRALVKTLLGEALGIPEPTGLLAERTHTLIWRGSKRQVEVVFANIRDTANVPAETFRSTAGKWRVVIDYPFDEETHSRVEDLTRLNGLRDEGMEARTISWVPYFLTADRKNDVGRLVVLEYLLTGTRFDDNAVSLPVGDREPARRALENQRQNLRGKVLDALTQAYDATTPRDGDVEISDTLGGARGVFDTLEPDLRISPPVVANLHGALDAVLGQAYDHCYPDHPRFEPSDSEIRRADLNTVWTLAQQAVASGGRLEGIDRNRASIVRRVANPLECGQARENVYALTPDTFGWRQHFIQWANTDGAADGAVQVGALRKRLEGHGMLHEVEDLLILCWSQVADRQWTRGGTNLGEPPGIGQVKDDMTLTIPELPDEDEWARATQRAAALFGVTADRTRGVRSVARLAQAIRAGAQATKEHTGELVSVLEEHAKALGLDPDALSGRLATARRASALDILVTDSADNTQLVKRLAAADVPDEPQALSKSRTTARDVTAVLAGADWDILRRLHTDTSTTSNTIKVELAEAARAEELHSHLKPALERARTAARDLFFQPTPPPPPDSVDDVHLVIDQTHVDDTLEQLRDFARKHPDRSLHVRWWVE